jgi:hypothetical protein
LTHSGPTIALRAASRALAVCAALLVLAITFGVAHAKDLQVAEILPMQLPVDLSCGIWFFAHEVWEDEEPLPPLPPPSATEDEAAGADPACTGDAAQRSADAGSPVPTTAPEPPRQVFKGYAYETRFNWLPCDSPVSRPWVQAPAQARSDDRRQHADEVDPSRLDPHLDPRLDQRLEGPQEPPAADVGDLDDGDPLR